MIPIVEGILHNEQTRRGVLRLEEFIEVRDEIFPEEEVRLYFLHARVEAIVHARVNELLRWFVEIVRCNQIVEVQEVDLDCLTFVEHIIELFLRRSAFRVEPTHLVVGLVHASHEPYLQIIEIYE